MHTPLPWVRIDALTLNLLWILPFSYPTEFFTYAWLMALMCLFISFGWAAGDVSLSAYIQASLSQSKYNSSTLGSVMAFLFTSYIVVYACLSFGLGKVIDQFVREKNPHGFLFWISGVMMSISCILILLSTFIPKGSFKLNPTMDDIGATVKEEEDKTNTCVASQQRVIAPEQKENGYDGVKNTMDKADSIQAITVNIIEII